MNIRELSRYMDLMGQIEVAQEILDRMLEKAAPGAQNMDGMPHSTDVGKPTESLAIEVADAGTALQELKAKAAREYALAESFINQISDFKVRTAFRLRFLHCKAWIEVADTMGPFYSDSAVRQIVYKYLKTCSSAEHVEASCSDAEQQTASDNDDKQLDQ